MDKICGFYVSNVHLITMILPFLKEQFKKEVNFITFFEEDLNKNINDILFNLITNENDKQKILNINWGKTHLKKYINMENNLVKIINEKNETIILIGGNKKYINETNNLLNRFFEKKNNKNIKIINCYNVLKTDDNIKEILDEHRYIINTSGLHEINEIFENYKKAN